MPTVTLFLPTPAGFDIPEAEPQRIATLRGARVAVLDNGWTSMDVISEILADELRGLGAAEVRHYETPHSRPSAVELLDEIAANTDAAIVGLGN
jgi:hypothetical protein